MGAIKEAGAVWKHEGLAFDANASTGAALVFVNQGAPPLPVDHMPAVPIFSPNGTHLLLPQGYTDDGMYMPAPVIVAD